LNTKNTKDQLGSMVGPAVQRVTSAEDLTKSEQHAEKHSSQAAPRAAAVPHYNNNYQRQQQQQQHQHSKHHHHYSGSDSGKRNGSQRASAAAQNQRGSDYRLGGVPDVSARTSMPSSASPSGRPPHSNLDRFLEVTTPSVKSQTLRKSCLRDSSQKRCFNPEVTPFFNLADLWDSFDEWSAYGAGVPLVLNGEESVVQYYVPYLSALQLYTLPSRRPDYPLGHRHPGGESDEGSEASSDNESELREGEACESEAKCRSFQVRGYKGAGSPPPNLVSSLGSSSRLDWSTFITDDDEEGEVWSYFEHSPPYSRVPLVDKIADLSRDFKPCDNPLRTLRSVDLLPGSWLSVAWYPIYRIPTGPTLRDLAACFLTFHSLSSSLHGEADNGSVRQVCRSDVCDVSSINSQRLALRAFGLASYKLKGAVWTSQPDRRQATSLQNSADEHLKQLDVQHPDYNFFTSNSGHTRR